MKNVGENIGAGQMAGPVKVTYLFSDLPPNRGAGNLLAWGGQPRDRSFCGRKWDGVGDWGRGWVGDKKKLKRTKATSITVSLHSLPNTKTRG